jgi:hypothetical protein
MKTAIVGNSKSPRSPPGFKEAVAASFDKLVSAQYNETVENEVAGSNY